MYFHMYLLCNVNYVWSTEVMPSMTAALDGDGMKFTSKGQKSADCDKDLCLTPGCVSAGELNKYVLKLMYL